LEAQNKEVELKNREVEVARQDLEEKAEQLALTSKYKSEFLANMSHELRTPLNSLLILSNMLAENKESRLAPKEVEYANTIHGAGSDLLALINDILDLSKIEAGKMSVDVGNVPFGEIVEQVDRSFRQVAEKKGLEFNTELGEGLPSAIRTDSKRLFQVLKNLLSNAFKFTEKGEVKLRVEVAAQGWSSDHPILNRAETVLAFAVSDTGVGIPKDKQRIIWEAFQQADGTTSRKYGGTGLGLSISREIARMLGGEIRLASTPGKGSTFTLYLPQTYQAPKARPKSQQATTEPRATAFAPETASEQTEEEADVETEPAAPRAAKAERPAAREVAESAELVAGELSDDRDQIEPGDRVLLIVEDDIRFARILVELAHEKGFKCLLATRGDTALAIAQKYTPDAITLDIQLPDMKGWAVLDQLKHHSTTRHIPVHIISVEAERQRGLRMGAFAYLQKPVPKDALEGALDKIKGWIEKPVAKLLIVEDDERERKSVAELIGGADVAITSVVTGEEAIEALKREPYDCMVLDLGLPDMSGFEVLEKIRRDDELSELPVVVYTGKGLTKRQETELKRVAESIIVKDVRSPARLLDETALFLHRVESRLPAEKKQVLEHLHQKDPVLAGKKVLVVDDDVRNVFAVTSLLEAQDMKVIYAENGRDGLARLEENPDTQIVLMDIMMPEMDGYEATRALRAKERFKNLPVIALTAKAMKGDREKCIDAGASDYLPKPIDGERLLSLLRVWLYK
ncbi:MAG: response regulator, partial [Coriobacteriia bacterium]